MLLNGDLIEKTFNFGQEVISIDFTSSNQQQHTKIKLTFHLNDIR